MKIWQIAIVAGAWWYLNRGGKEWVKDLLVRGYAKDWMVDPPSPDDPEKAADWQKAKVVSSQTGLPLAWVVNFLDLGVPVGSIHAVAGAAIRVIREVGPPTDASEAGLKAYKDKVVRVVMAAYKQSKNKSEVAQA